MEIKHVCKKAPCDLDTHTNKQTCVFASFAAFHHYSMDGNTTDLSQLMIFSAKLMLCYNRNKSVKAMPFQPDDTKPVYFLRLFFSLAVVVDDDFSPLSTKLPNAKESRRQK